MGVEEFGAALVGVLRSAPVSGVLFIAPVGVLRIESTAQALTRLTPPPLLLFTPGEERNADLALRFAETLRTVKLVLAFPE